MAATDHERQADGGDGLPDRHIARSDGAREVTHNGQPLHYYAGDQAAGDTNGEGLDAFGGGWDVLSPAGSNFEGDDSGAAGSSSTGSGY